MSKAGNGRYINADNYEERLQRLLLVYEAEGQTDHAAATAVAIRMLQTERAFERVDVRRNLILEKDRILQQLLEEGRIPQQPLKKDRILQSYSKSHKSRIQHRDDLPQKRAWT